MHWCARGRNSVPARAIADIAPKRFDECAKRDMPCTVSFLECGGLTAAFAAREAQRDDRIQRCFLEKAGNEGYAVKAVASYRTSQKVR
jgi:hypothetical protein